MPTGLVSPIRKTVLLGFGCWEGGLGRVGRFTSAGRLCDQPSEHPTCKSQSVEQFHSDG